MTDTLSPGQEMQKNVPLESLNGYYRFVFQSDGNLVLYSNNTGNARWQSNTDEKLTQKCILQDDGNLVIYGLGKVLWASNTKGNSGSYLKVQNDGNVEIFNSDNVRIWNTNTFGEG